MENNLKHIVYLTTNVVNKKIYIGVHCTDPNIFDGYIGNGVNIYNKSSILHPKTPFQYAVKKYGFDKFIRSTIQVFDDRNDALSLERILVDDKFILRDDTYNITIGGGDPPHYLRKVFKYDLNGNFLDEYESLAKAKKENYKASTIDIAIKYKCVSGGYLWSDKYYDKIDVSEYLINIQNIKCCLYNNDCSFYREFNSIMDAVRFLNVSLGPVQRAIKLQTKIKNFYISLDKLDRFTPIKYPKHNSEVYRYDLQGNYIDSFKSCLEASRILGKEYNQISHCIRMGKPCGEYLWSWDKRDKIKAYIRISKSKKVGQYDLDGNLIKIFNTVRECRKEFGNVSRVLRGAAELCKGYKFKYIE